MTYGDRADTFLAVADEIAGLRREFPAFDISAEFRPGRGRRYVARATRPGLNPHTVITPDPGELRAALADPDGTSHAR